MYQRKLVKAIISRMSESDNPLIQVIAGPRQTGKSTAIAQALEQVDFVLRGSERLAAVEVKSGRTKSQSGMAAFLKKHPHAMRIVIGGSSSGACTLEDFLLDRVALPWA